MGVGYTVAWLNDDTAEVLYDPEGHEVARFSICHAPEDVTFYRDLKPVWDELNNLYEIVRKLKEGP